MYYYRRKTSPIKWLIIIVILLIIGVLTYWFYVNYFSKIDFSRPTEETDESLEIEKLAKILLANLFFVQGEVEADIANSGYQKAVSDTILRQGDKIRTGKDGLAILNLESGSVIRLGPGTEIILQDLAEDNLILNQTKGRTYHNLEAEKKYQVKSLDVEITTLETKFEVITNSELEFLAIFVYREDKAGKKLLFSRDACNPLGFLDLSIFTSEKILARRKAVRTEANMDFTKEQLRVALDMLEQIQMSYVLSVLLGGPGEDRSTVEETVDFLRDRTPLMLDFGVGIRLMPHTRLADLAVKEGLISADDPLMEPKFYLSPHLEGWIEGYLTELCSERPGWTVAYQ